MMKGRASTTLILSLGLMALYSIRQISLSSTSISTTAQVIKTYLTSPSPSPSPPPVICDRSHYHYDACSINGPTVMDPTTSTFHFVGPTAPMQKLRPYPRKYEGYVMSKIKAVSLLPLTPTNATPSCHVHHSAPAIVFSNGGYTGNLFHDFSDGFIPLFITTRHLLSRRHRDRDVVLVVADLNDWWLTKYAELIRGLTRHPVINFDNETSLYCFPSATIGLISHGFSAINASLMPTSESLTDFRGFLDRSYGESGLRPLPPPLPSRPQLVLVARNGTVGRLILNQEDVAHEAEAAGFKVTVFTPSRFTSLREAYRLINGSHALFGVHGAALTHFLFLRPGAVLIQVVPLGLDWAAHVCFGAPAQQLGMEYMEYKIRVEESSLLEKHDRNDVVLKNPSAVGSKGWSYTKDIYLKDQDVRLDLARVRKYFKEAYKKAKRLMNLEGKG